MEFVLSRHMWRFFSLDGYLSDLMFVFFFVCLNVCIMSAKEAAKQAKLYLYVLDCSFFFFLSMDGWMHGCMISGIDFLRLMHGRNITLWVLIG